MKRRLVKSQMRTSKGIKELKELFIKETNVISGNQKVLQEMLLALSDDNRKIRNKLDIKNVGWLKVDEADYREEDIQSAIIKEMAYLVGLQEDGLEVAQTYLNNENYKLINPAGVLPQNIRLFIPKDKVIFQMNGEKAMLIDEETKLVSELSRDEVLKTLMGR